MVVYRPTELTDDERAESTSDAVVKSAATTSCASNTPLRLLGRQQQPPASDSTRRIDSLLFNPRFIFEQARRKYDGRVDIDALTTTTTRDSAASTVSGKTLTTTDRARKTRKDFPDNAIPPPPPPPTTTTRVTRSSTARKNPNSNSNTTNTKKGATKTTTTTTSTPTTTAATGEIGAPMMESLSSFLRAGKKPVNWNVPEELWRPAFQEVSNEAIAAADPRLDGVAPQYVRDQLEDFGSSLLFGMTGVKTIPPKNNVLLPYIDVVYPNVATIPPTHMIAVFSSLRPRPNTHPPVSIFPVHSIFLAAHCARLPPMLATPPPPPPPPAAGPSRAEGHQRDSERTGSPGSDSSSGSAETVTPSSSVHKHSGRTDLLTLPVHPIALPDPDTFSMLIGYLYHKRTDILLSKLLPLPPPPKLEVNQLTEIPRFGREIGRVCGWQKVFLGLWRVRGLWMNVCQLGVFDEFLWDSMELAWEVLVVAWGVEEEGEEGGASGEDGDGGPKTDKDDDVPLSPMGYEGDRSG